MPMRVVKGKTFTGQKVDLDGVAFVDCTFDACHLTFRGTNEFRLTNPTLKGDTTMELAGAAKFTLGMLRALHHSGVPSIQTWVDYELDRVRKPPAAGKPN